MSNIITNSDGMIEIYNGPELELKIKPNNFLEQYKTEINRIGQKYPVPCKEMVKEIVDFIYPKCEKFSGEYDPVERWKQGIFVISLMDEYYMDNPINFVEIWKKYAFEMAKENNQYCTVDFDVSKVRKKRHE